MNTPKKIADALNALNLQYGNEIPKAIRDEAADNGIVIAYGDSDDLLELRGAVHDELGAWKGTTAHFYQGGIITNKCDNENCPYHIDAMREGVPVQLIWGSPGGPTWSFKTDIPHETFIISEDGHPFCVGIVFALHNVVRSQEMIQHMSDCAVHNGPALPKGPCDCGAVVKSREEFERLSRPLIDYLCREWHPHVTIIITPTSAELVSGECVFTTEEYLRD